MNFAHFAGVLGLILGIYLQKNSHFILCMYPDLKSSRNLNTIFLLLGLLLELTSMAVIPLSTYVLISSIHIAAFKHILIIDENRKYTSSETFGTMGIISGSLIALLFGGIQLEIPKESYLKVFDFYYFAYTLGSLMATLIFRRYRFVSEKVIIETGIPAQIGSFAIAALKIL